MIEYLICRSSDEEGKIVFLTYDPSDAKIHEYSNDEITQKIVEKQLDNARLENTVVKITDSKRALPKLSFEEKSQECVFYIVKEYISEDGSEMFLAVSNAGTKYEFSRNIASDFCRDRQVINGYMGSGNKEFHVINVPVHNTVLQKSLEMVKTK